MDPEDLKPDGGQRHRRVAIYTRISQDRTGQQLGVTRQREDCEALVKSRGWQLIDHYPEHGTPASTLSRSPRPEYERMLSDGVNGRVDTVVAYSVDRLTRRLAEFVFFLEWLKEHKVAFVTTEGDSTLTANGRLVLTIKSAVAQQEAERLGERVTRASEQRAQSGRPHGSMLSFGYYADGGVNVEQAEVVRDCVTRLLAGESLRSLVLDLNAREVPTLRGGVWRTSTLRAILASARISGQREWTPKASGRRGYGFGQIVAKGSWEPIITPTQTEAVRRLLTEPSRRTTRPAQHLLSGGILRCGRCGGAMNSRSDKRGGRQYACIAVPGTGRCGGISVRAEPTDEYVVGLLMASLEDVPVGVPKPEGDEVERELDREIDEVRAVLDQVTDDHYAGLLDRRSYLRQRERQQARLDALMARVASSQRQDALAGLPRDRDTLDGVWDGWSLEQQRRVLRAVFARVEVHPAQRGVPRFDPSRIHPKFIG